MSRISVLSLLNEDGGSAPIAVELRSAIRSSGAQLQTVVDSFGRQEGSFPLGSSLVQTSAPASFPPVHLFAQNQYCTVAQPLIQQQQAQTQPEVKYLQQQQLFHQISQQEQQLEQLQAQRQQQEHLLHLQGMHRLVPHSFPQHLADQHLKTSFNFAPAPNFINQLAALYPVQQQQQPQHFFHIPRQQQQQQQLALSQQKPPKACEQDLPMMPQSFYRKRNRPQQLSVSPETVAGEADLKRSRHGTRTRYTRSSSSSENNEDSDDYNEDEDEPVFRSNRPRGYWREFDNVKKELLSVIGNLRDLPKGQMPTQKELRDAGASASLKDAIRKHGGTAVVARRLGLVTTPKSTVHCHKPREEDLALLEPYTLPSEGDHKRKLEGVNL